MRNYRLIIDGVSSRLMSRREAYNAMCKVPTNELPIGTVLTVNDRGDVVVFTRTVKGNV